MRIQLNILAASVAMAVAGGAQAGNLGAANEIFVGGATAPQNFFREDLTIRVCNANAAPVQVFVDSVATMPSETPGGGILNAGDQMVVRCTAKGSFPAPLANADIAVYKFNGGSATGVAPVVDPDNAADGVKRYLDANLDPANGPVCTPVTNSQGNNEWPIGLTGDSFELYECADSSLVKVQDPDAGISDIEPSAFVGPLALNFGTEPLGVAQRATQSFEDLGNLQLRPGPGLVFGTIVTLPMYDELLEDQAGAGLLPADCATASRAERDAVRCMPSLPSALIRSAFLGQISSWEQFAPYGLSLDPAGVAEGNNVHLCKRTNGSGTHAQFSIHFLETNCTATSNFSMLEQNDGVSFAGAGFVGMYANSGSSDMNDCVGALGDGTGFDGDFDGLPQTAFFGTGDSSVVPGSGLDANAGIVQTAAFGNHPLGLTYNNGGSPFTAYGMGYNSLENNTQLNFAHRFVKVDGIAPTLENAIAGTYKDVYYLSYQNRVAGGKPDLRTGAIRTAVANNNQVAVASEYFKIWNAVAPEAIIDVNATLAVDPDGTLGNDDDWQGGFVTPLPGASAGFDGTNPATPWARQQADGTPDSCQDLSIVR